MNYVPMPLPQDPKQLPAHVERELRRIGQVLSDAADTVFYRTLPNGAASLSVSAGISANWRVAGNVLLLSSSATQTITGLMRDKFAPMREVVIFNIGTGVITLKSEGTESSASNRFTLTGLWNISANGAAVLWRDPFAFRWRGLSRTP